jgi:hypothetical protein
LQVKRKVITHKTIAVSGEFCTDFIEKYLTKKKDILNIHLISDSAVNSDPIGEKCLQFKSLDLKSQGIELD